MTETPPKRSQRSIFRARAIASVLSDSEDGTPDILVRPPWQRLLIGAGLLGLAFWLWP
ncbi:MAG: hypothetical protein JJU22_09335 [Gammaproteobacteria bacterium]|nr:hypothetical protein [Gammaproteobacteria bacterium]